MNKIFIDRIIKERFFTGVFWNVLSVIVLQGGTFLTSVVIARILGREIYGQYAIVQNTVATFSVIAGVGISLMATKYVAELRMNDPIRCARILGLADRVTKVSGLFFFLLVMASSSFIATNILEAPGLSHLLVIAAIYILFITSNGFQLGVLVGLEAFRKILLINSIYVFISILLAVTFSYFFSLDGTVLILSANAFLLWLLHRIVMLKELRKNNLYINRKDIWKEKSVFIHFALPSAYSGLFLLSATWITNSLLVRSADGFNEMALFAASNTLKTLIIFIPVPISKVTSALLNHLIGQKDKSSFNAVFKANLLISIGIAVVFTGVLALFPDKVLYVYGEAFVDARNVLAILAFAALLEVVSGVFHQKLLAEEKQWTILAITIIWSISLLLLSITFIPQYGALGLAFSYLLSWLMISVIYIVLYVRSGIVSGVERK